MILSFKKSAIHPSLCQPGKFANLSGNLFYYNDLWDIIFDWHMSCFN